MDPIVLIVFFIVYAGMIVGDFRGLALDRTGIVLLGAIALVATDRVTPEDAWKAVDVPTIALLFGLMVVSAQFRLGGFYSFVTNKLGSSDAPAARFLLAVQVVAGGLSALLANDIVVLAMTPILVEICQRRRLRALPFLIGLACAANIGSAATLIGNPQNMLIGQVLQLSFARYLFIAFAPSALGIIACWGILAWCFRGRWTDEISVPHVEPPPFNAWQTGKGVAVLAGLMIAFLWNPIPREQAALLAAGVLLLSRRLKSSEFLALVDWNLLVLFMGLFIVNHSLAESGALDAGLRGLHNAGIDLNSGPTLFGTTVVLSNLVSNVPATMLLLRATTHPAAGPILALASTLAGNLIIVGSIANIIVVEQAQKMGVRIGWAEHARYGIPVTLATLAIAAAWLAIVL